MKHLLPIAVLAAVLALAGPAGAVEPQITDPCGPITDVEEESEMLVPEHLDICTASADARYEDDRLLVDLSMKLFGDPGDRPSTSYQFAWRNASAGCTQLLEIRDSAPVPDAARVVFRYECTDWHVVGINNLSPDTCLRALPLPGDTSCIGERGTVVAVPDSAVTVSGTTLNVTLDVAALLPEEALAHFAPGTQMTHFYTAASQRVGPYRDHVDRGGVACLLSHCPKLQPVSDEAETTAGFVIPARPE